MIHVHVEAGRSISIAVEIIDYIARKTRNTRADVVNALGEKDLKNLMIWLMCIIVTI